MALIATLLGFTVVINYLINLIYKIEGVGRDQEEMNSRLKEVELKLELAKKLEKKEEEFFEAIMNKASKSDLDEKKENIVALREEIKNYK
jgi:hypothetical protein